MKKEEEKRTRYFLIVYIATITAEITMVIGFFIIMFFILRKYL